MDAKSMVCIGHRGACGHAPENTLASIRKALELGAQCLEIDVYLVDGRLVVFHDDRLERTTDGAGYLADQRFDDLRALDAGNGERIPTLEEVFDTLDRRAGINIELKGPGTARPVVERVRQYRSRGWGDDLILVSSFDHRQLAEVRRLDPRIKIGALHVGLPVDDAAFAAALGAYSVHSSIEFIDQRFVDDAHARGLRVFVFTVNHPDDIRKMAALGVDGIFTDFPDRVPALQPKGRPTIGWPAPGTPPRPAAP